MYHRRVATFILSVAIGVAILGAVPRVQAQTRSTRASEPVLSPTSLLSALSRYRAVRWASSTPAWRCRPAPLTERPGVEAEYARPHVAPLEEAFADAQSVRRAMAYQAGTLAMEKR